MALPLDLIAQAVPRLSRHELEALTERLIEHLNGQDGDGDIEPNGDELDGSSAEDDWQPGSEGAINRPGCPISDPGEDDDSDFCLAGDDRVCSGPVLIADALGFSARPSRYNLGMDDDCERDSPPEMY